MLMNLLLGVSMMIICLLLQAALLISAERYYHRHDYLLNSPSVMASMIVVSGTMILLLIGNLGQIALWALLFEALGEFEQFAEAFYHSAVNFATLGYGDFVMSADHKLLGPLEALNGVLMIGFTTSSLMTGYQDAVRRTQRARQQQRDG